jgi:DNA polymerase III alpha subunit
MNRYQVIDLHYEKRGFNLTGHPIEKIRKYIYARRKQYAFMNLNKIRDSAELTRQINELEINGSACLFLAKRPVATIGIIICRQKPPTARGVAFLTLEDEKGIMNVTIYPNLFNKRFNDIAYSSAVYVSGILQNIGSVVYILANDIRYLA